MFIKKYYKDMIKSMYEEPESWEINHVNKLFENRINNIFLKLYSDHNEICDFEINNKDIKLNFFEKYYIIYHCNKIIKRLRRLIPEDIFISRKNSPEKFI